MTMTTLRMTPRATAGDATADSEVGTDPMGCDAQTAPLCSFDCGGDAFESPDCIANEWICPPDTTPIDDCPPGSCFGAPLPGEVCDGGWQCRPWETGALDSCPAGDFLCADCNGFDEPYDTGECVCTCDAGTVSCESAGDPCEVESSSDLDGVRLELSGDRCRWAIDEVAAGIEIPFALVAETAVTAVPIGQDAGGCGGPFGLELLYTFIDIRGSDDRYCLCDTGLCAGTETPVDVSEGRSEATIEWSGRNWGGPSDTGNPMGEPFPPGRYTVSVSARGYTLDAAGVQVPYELRSSMQIELTE